QNFLGGFASGPAFTPNDLRSRNSVVGAPGAVRKFVKILAGTDFTIEIAHIYSMQGLLLRMCRLREASNGDDRKKNGVQLSHEDLGGAWESTTAEEVTYEVAKYQSLRLAFNWLRIASLRDAAICPACCSKHSDVAGMEGWANGCSRFSWAP